MTDARPKDRQLCACGHIAFKHVANQNTCMEEQCNCTHFRPTPVTSNQWLRYERLGTLQARPYVTGEEL